MNEDSAEFWEQVVESQFALESDYKDCIDFLRNKQASSSEEEIALATTIATLERFREATLNASEMLAAATAIISLANPTEQVLEFIEIYADQDSNSRNVMEAILIMVNMAITDQLNGEL